LRVAVVVMFIMMQRCMNDSEDVNHD